MCGARSADNVPGKCHYNRIGIPSFSLRVKCLVTVQCSRNEDPALLFARFRADGDEKSYGQPLEPLSVLKDGVVQSCRRKPPWHRGFAGMFVVFPAFLRCIHLSFLGHDTADALERCEGTLTETRLICEGSPCKDKGGNPQASRKSDGLPK